MASLTDTRFAALRSLGYAGSTSDMMQVWLKDGGPEFGLPGITANDIPTLWYQVLTGMQAANPFIFEADGTTPLTNDRYDRNDWWSAWLLDKGFAGQYNTQQVDYWLSKLP